MLVKRTTIYKSCKQRNKTITGVSMVYQFFFKSVDTNTNEFFLI